MTFEETKFKGLYKIDLERRGDERGFFARVFCVNEFDEHGLNRDLVQINITSTADKDTFRGLHYQTPPKAEDKIVMVTKGAMYDVSLDLRPNSPTFGQYHGMELNEKDKTMLYIPKGFAHGYLILEDNTEALYFVTEFYGPENERVIRWDDPKFDIKLPREPVHTSEKDTEADDFDEKIHLEGMESLQVS